MPLVLVLCGCTLADFPYVKKTAAQQEVTKLELAHASELAAKVKAISDTKDGVIKGQDLALQTVANSLYGADRGFTFYVTPTRLDLAIHNRVTEAMAASGKSPTYAAVVAENKRLADELDATKTSLEDLRKNHDTKLAENLALAASVENEKQELAVKTALLVQTQEDHREAMEKVQGKLNDTNDEIIAFEKKRADEQASIERLKNKLMIACGVAALACLIGCIYSPVGKGTLGMLAAILGAAAVAIPFIQGWMILVTFLAVGGVALAWFFYNHHTATKANGNIINALQDVAEKDKDIFDKVIAPKLSEWNTTYVKKAGALVSVADEKVKSYVKSVLAKHNRL